MDGIKRNEQELAITEKEFHEVGPNRLDVSDLAIAFTIAELVDATPANVVALFKTKKNLINASLYDTR